MIKKKFMTVQGGEIATMRVSDEDYICLTDMVKKFEGSKSLIGNWMTRKDTIQFLGLWEQMHNPHFKLLEFQEFRSKAGSNNFSLSAQRWIESTGAIGITSKSGKYGGTYAQKDIAFEFATWLSPEFKLYLIKEFQRMKEGEQKGLAWDVRRVLSKVNYRIHTTAVKDILIPLAGITKENEAAVYADEAEMFNLILFGTTSTEWRKEYPQAALRGENIRDHANILQLTVLSNLETLNSTLIRDDLNKADRYTKLKRVAREQLQHLVSSQTQLEAIENSARNDSSDKQDLQKNVRTLSPLPIPPSYHD